MRFQINNTETEIEKQKKKPRRIRQVNITLRTVHPSQLYCNPLKPIQISMLREIMDFKNL